MLFSGEEIQTMLERTGGAVHTVDGDELFCRVKDQGVAPDEFGRGMVAKAELTHIAGDTFTRTCRHDTVVDGIAWSIALVRQRLSGLVVWSLEREVG